MSDTKLKENLKPIDESSNIEYCSVCSTKLEGEYCYHCGQRLIKTKNGILEIFVIFFSGMLSAEKGFFGAMINFTKSPRYIVTNYWNGFRKYYFSPAQMIFYVTFVIGLHLAFINKNILGFVVTLSGVSEEASNFLSPQLVFLVMVIPFFAFTTSIVYFRQKHTLPEHFIASAYIFSYAAILCTIVGDILLLIFAFEDAIIGVAFNIILFSWGIRVFSTKNKWYQIIAQFFLLIMTFIVLLGLFIAALYFFNPGNTGFTIKE